VLFTYLLRYFLSFLILLIRNVVIIWSCLVVLTFIRVYILVMSSNFNTIEYYVVQELGNLLLFLTMLQNEYYLSCLIIMFKAGAAPFHFWIIKIYKNIHSVSFCMFMSIFKLPHIFVLIKVYIERMMIILISGVLILNIQLIKVSSPKSYIVLRSSFILNIAILCTTFSEILSITLVLTYISSLIIVVHQLMYRFNINISCVIILWFLNFPFIVSFIIKLMMLSLSVFIILWILLVLMSLLSHTFPLISFILSYCNNIVHSLHINLNLIFLCLFIFFSSLLLFL